MARRVGYTAAELRIDNAALVATYAGRTLQHRSALLTAHDPRLLHPARTALILMVDDGVRDAHVLGAAVLFESLDTHLSADISGLEPEIRHVLDAVPRPEPADTLLERLLVAEPGCRAVALAEMLDHARHLHFYPRPQWQPIHDLVTGAYLPVAEREGGLIGRRFRRWSDAFQRRRLRR